MKNSHFFGDWWFLCDFLCHFWWFFGWDLGTPAILRQNPNIYEQFQGKLSFGQFWKKKNVGIGSDPPPSLGQIPNFYRKFVSGAPLNVMSYLEFPASLLRAESDHCAFSWARLPHTPPVRKRQWAEYQWSDFTCIHAERLPQCVDKPAGALPGSCDLRRDESEHLCSNQATSFDLMSLACLGESMEQVLDVQEGRPEDTM